MNKSGQDDFIDKSATGSESASASRRGCALWLIALLFLIVLIALIFGVQLFGIISVLVFPPDAPLPSNSIEISHDNEAHGADTWVFTTTLSPCDVISFYEQNNSACTSAGALCSDGEYESPGFPLRVSSCTGTESVSIFGLRWEVDIFTEFYEGEEQTRFQLLRDVLWTGSSTQAIP